ncbi:hypothetical protein LELG_01009 [Lodderomyces elongisporus NRRL YB-4239]|uniref:THO complex subunit 2 n=1 Tax=Lodderomyces elongisporus (strain ATCC 11503 / CBS 2605 / JCM 1781 / NBRC 1676 / NRRL YB-4239) TaxID=379508 RepID=A5DUH3_LODEL|nr:hypothetical protein LELG_01009 [Lodderomyces elongisporus NRRL YB-4239]
MSFQYFTQEVLDEFDGSGRVEILEALDSFESNSQESEDEIVILFTELVLSYEENKLKVADIVDFLSQAIKNDDIARMFCQVLNSFPISEKSQELLQTLVQKENIIKPDTIGAHISTDFIKECELVPKAVLTRTLNTRLRDSLYTQRKFNLLYQETEGFSKLISEMHNIFSNDNTDLQIDYALQVIDKLIGHYDLDPNRCLDVLLDVLPNFIIIKPECVVLLLRKSKWWPIKESNNTTLENLSDGGSNVATRIYALKFLSHKDKEFSESFKQTITILIKEGFLSFGSIYKYLLPNDEGMKPFKDAYDEKVQEKVLKAGASALALAAPLADDEDESSTEPKSKTKPVVESRKATNLALNQKFQLLKTFALNGLYWPTIYILSEYPFLADVDNEIKVSLCRMFGAILEPFYKSVTTTSLNDNNEVSHLTHAKGVYFARTGNKVAIEPVKYTDFLRYSATKKDYSNKRFHYFYKDWTSGLPLINSFETLMQVSQDFLKFIGSNLSDDIVLFSKLCDVVQSFAQEEQYKDQVFHYFRNYIFPVMPLITENSIAIDKAFAILAIYPLEDRFSVYGELYNNLRKNNLQIKIAYSVAEKSTKDALKRLSKENIRPMMRRLAKICFSNPLPCLLTILQQIESYDNLITLVVETARYFNDYGWDNLTVAILIRLSSDRNASQDNGMIDRQWLQSLASFIGKICQRYPKAIDIKTILSYLIKSFYAGERTGILVLKEMLSSMGGIQSSSDLTLRQIDMISSGSSLLKMVYRIIDDVRYNRVTSGSHLLECFKALNCTTEVIILLCLILNDLVYDQAENQLKVLASRADDISEVIKLFITLIDFFGNGDSLELMPIEEMTESYGVPVEWAFDLWRTKKHSDDVLNLDEFGSKICPVNFPSSLYSSFWYLSLGDINYSDSLYNGEVEKLESSIRGLRNAITMNARNSDYPKATIEKHRREIDENKVFIQKLPLDKQIHRERNERIDEQLSKLSSNWFCYNNEVNGGEQKEMLVRFMQHCIFPRALHSSFDAVYAARFIFKLHAVKVANYSLIGCLDVLFNSEGLFGSLYSSTPAEIESLGFFYADILKTLAELRVEQKKFEDFKLYDFDEFRNSVYKYHSTIVDAIEQSLTTPDYMSRNNAILFLKGLLSVFPIVEDHGEKVVRLVELILASDSRDDIKLSSGALLGHIKAKATTWIPIYDFIPMSDEAKQNIIKDKKIAREKEEAERKKIEERILREKREKIAKEEVLKKNSTIDYNSMSTQPNRPISRATTIDSKSKYAEYAPVARVKADKDSATGAATGAAAGVGALSAISTNGGETKHTNGIGAPTIKEDTPQSDSSKTKEKIDIKTRLLQLKEQDRQRRSQSPVGEISDNVGEQMEEEKISEIKDFGANLLLSENVKNDVNGGNKSEKNNTIAKSSNESIDTDATPTVSAVTENTDENSLKINEEEKDKLKEEEEGEREGEKEEKSRQKIPSRPHIRPRAPSRPQSRASNESDTKPIGPARRAPLPPQERLLGKDSRAQSSSREVRESRGKYQSSASSFGHQNDYLIPPPPPPIPPPPPPPTSFPTQSTGSNRNHNNNNYNNDGDSQANSRRSNFNSGYNRHNNGSKSNNNSNDRDQPSLTGGRTRSYDGRRDNRGRDKEQGDTIAANRGGHLQDRKRRADDYGGRDRERSRGSYKRGRY